LVVQDSRDLGEWFRQDAKDPVNVKRETHMYDEVAYSRGMS
jgi:hypothetical protein